MVSEDAWRMNLRPDEEVAAEMTDRMTEICESIDVVSGEGLVDGRAGRWEGIRNFESDFI